MQKLLIALGICIVVIGLGWPWLSKLPIGKLPGDIMINKPGLKVFFPITSMILISAIVSIILWFYRNK